MDTWIAVGFTKTHSARRAALVVSFADASPVSKLYWNPLDGSRAEEVRDFLGLAPLATKEVRRGIDYKYVR